MRSVHKIKYWMICFMLLSFYSCNDFLDQVPQSQISPEKYLKTDAQLEAYVNGLYDILPSGIILTKDAHTDNQAASAYSEIYVPGQWKVSQTGGEWSFGVIHNCNYFLERVIPKYEADEISGIKENIEHYIGEAYFLRAFEYFNRYKALGDFPIVTTILADDKSVLTEASKRMPRNEVARFIISDLDKAIEFMEKSPDSRKTRVNKATALLLKSRVGLYEGTFLKYFKGTAFVPKGQGWPGETKEYNKNYEYPDGSIEAEINYFLDQSIYASRQVAEMIALTENTGNVQQDKSETANPYMDMFASVDLSGYKEVLLWREYSKGLDITHGMGECTQKSNNGVGVTRGLAESFLMANGLPIYATDSGYAGDDYIEDVRKDRDSRLFLFLKEPGQKNVITGPTAGGDIQSVETIPNINGMYGPGLYTTGYTLRKGNPLDGEQSIQGAGTGTYTGIISFRGVEALLNYIEAYYERTGTINATAKQYWEMIRNRAKIDPDFNKTIAATDMSKEAGNDWGAYSAGTLIDPTLYNIRRERRCELMGDGLRDMDLQRWRAKDQMITTPYHIEGFKVWGPMKEWYKNSSGGYDLSYGLDTPGAYISPPDRSDYLRPYEKSRKSLVLDGYRWNMAHYLSPIAVEHFILTSDTDNLSASPIYQNPGWPITAGQGPEN